MKHCEKESVTKGKRSQARQSVLYLTHKRVMPYTPQRGNAKGRIVQSAHSARAKRPKPNNREAAQPNTQLLSHRSTHPSHTKLAQTHTRIQQPELKHAN